jgi:ubiquinone/menaquinone biosynthesis C-methylase UbiE
MSDRNHKSDVLRDVIDHYQEVDEDSRLQTGWFRLEHARTQELLLRHLPPPPATLLDIGGGSGIYAFWLASRGYHVHLVDPVPKHIEQARSYPHQHTIASLRLGDARNLEQSDTSAGAVLMLGPLYHLTDHAERLRSLREARRVLRPGGTLCAAAISHFASLYDSLQSGFFDDPEFIPILERDLDEGQHRNTTSNPIFFTTAFFHRPNELAAEIAEAGFQLVELLPIEGPGWFARDFDRLWKDHAQRERLLECIRKVEHEPALLGASAHLMAIARK